MQSDEGSLMSTLFEACATSVLRTATLSVKLMRETSSTVVGPARFALDPFVRLLLWGPPGCGKRHTLHKLALIAGHETNAVLELSALELESRKDEIAEFLANREAHSLLVLDIDLLSDFKPLIQLCRSIELNQSPTFLGLTATHLEHIDGVLKGASYVDLLHYVGLPSQEARLAILRRLVYGPTLLANQPNSEDHYNLAMVAEISSGYTAQELKQLVRRALMYSNATEELCFEPSPLDRVSLVTAASEPPADFANWLRQTPPPIVRQHPHLLSDARSYRIADLDRPGRVACARECIAHTVISDWWS